jgi:hypothetical protein
LFLSLSHWGFSTVNFKLVCAIVVTTMSVECYKLLALDVKRWQDSSLFTRESIVMSASNLLCRL